ncbi:NIPSNAP family protein [Paenibacillus sp. R14(2021)]|uniref:NIPSNAP family protein n=1 Tax=Paenibacillus sp. R14(2021) TaxID=2859228 RepID=UPI001C61682A|nr:NIPSNAP family protein [Paenibacillus sp. R14(2021)]
MLYELRIYDVHPGKMQTIRDRFRDHVIALFAKHDMRITLFWEDAEEVNNRLYYVVEHDDMDARNLNYERFRADPEWIEVKRVSEQGGPIVKKQESIFMKNAAFFQASN